MAQETAATVRGERTIVHVVRRGAMVRSATLKENRPKSTELGEMSFKAAEL